MERWKGWKGLSQTDKTKNTGTAPAVFRSPRPQGEAHPPAAGRRPFSDVVAKLIDVPNELARDPELNVSDLLWGKTDKP